MPLYNSLLTEGDYLCQVTWHYIRFPLSMLQWIFLWHWRSKLPCCKRASEKATCKGIASDIWGGEWSLGDNQKENGTYILPSNGVKLWKQLHEHGRGWAPEHRQWDTLMASLWGPELRSYFMPGFLNHENWDNKYMLY